MSALADKLCPPAELATRLAQGARPLVMTNGVFDVLHRGHVQYLEQAAALGAQLLVALNTDASARGLGKGPQRPLNPLEDRAHVVAALASVSLVTWFDAPTPCPLLAQLRPDVYVKGGDYDMDRLPEAALVRSWGGQALALPFLAGRATSALVNKILQRPAVFLDRDGVIVRDSGYPSRWEDLVLLPGAVDAMRRLRQAGYRLVIVTNQSGIGRGLFSEATYQSLSERLQRALQAAGAGVDGVYHCPHRPAPLGATPGCDCRKPQPGLLLRAARELGLDLAASIMIGDRPSDVQAGRAAGLAQAWQVGPGGDFADLAACADHLLGAGAGAA